MRTSRWLIGLLSGLVLWVGLGVGLSGQALGLVDVPLQVHAWTTYGSTPLSQGPDGALTWDLNGAHYVYTAPIRTHGKTHTPKKHAWLTSLLDVSTLVFTARIRTTGAPVFGYGFGPDNPCLTPASARPLLWAAGNDWYDEFARWWPHISYPLASQPTGVTVRIPLDPHGWSSVYGKAGDASPDARAGWQHTRARPGSVGLTFGGGCFYGHGVWVTGGTAPFELLDYHFE